MAANLSDLGFGVLRALQLRSPYALTISIAVATVAYVFAPIILQQEIFRLTTPQLAIKLPVEFATVEIQLASSLVIDTVGYTLEGGRDKKRDLNRALPTRSVNEEVSSYTIKNPIGDRSSFAKRYKYIVCHIHFAPVSHAEISAIVLDGTRITRENLVPQYIAPANIEDKRMNSIREDLGEFLVRENDTFSNLALAAMLFLLLPLSIRAAHDVFLLVFGNEDRLLAHMLSETPPDSGASPQVIDDSRVEASMRFCERDAWYRLMQGMGPAVGFGLTISSLIVALHPSVQSNLDTTMFFSAVQVAMVSTFLGLMVRIIALVLGRLNERLLLRVDAVLDGLLITAASPDSGDGA